MDEAALPQPRANIRGRNHGPAIPEEEAHMPSAGGDPVRGLPRPQANVRGRNHGLTTVLLCPARVVVDEEDYIRLKNACARTHLSSASRLRPVASDAWPRPLISAFQRGIPRCGWHLAPVLLLRHCQRTKEQIALDLVLKNITATANLIILN